MKSNTVRGYHYNGELHRGETEFSYIIGVTLQEDDYVKEPHSHYMYEVQCALAGAWELCTEDAVYHVEPMSCVFIPSFAIHNMVCKDSGGQKIALKFSVNTVGASNLFYLKMRNILSSVSLPLILSDSRLSAIFALLATHTDKAELRDILFNDLASALILLVAEKIEESAAAFALSPRSLSTSDCQYASKIELSILYSFADPSLTLENFAAQIHLSAKQVERICKRVFNCTFGTLLTQQRMLAAQHLILEGRKLTEVADKVGYNSYAAFYRRYKAFYGCNPKAAEKNI